MLGPVTITGGSPGTNTKLPVTFAVLTIVPFDGTLTTVTWNVTSTLSPGFISGSGNPLLGLNPGCNTPSIVTLFGSNAIEEGNTSLY